MPMAMNAVQGNTPPKWKGRSRWSLLKSAVGGWAQNRDKLKELGGMVQAFVTPSVVRARLGRLRELGHLEATPNISQLLIASRDQLSFSLGAETKEFYRTQGIPWVFHNLRRFIAFPTSMMDPVGFFSPRDTIVHHVLQTFHRHPLYDLVLLRAHPGGVEEMLEQLRAAREGRHLHQASLESLVEDGSYWDRLARDVPEFAKNPHVAPRPIPEGLVADPRLMLAMDQFKDVRGYTNYAARIDSGPLEAVAAFAQVAFNETVGSAVGVQVGRTSLRVECCDAPLVAKHLGESAVSSAAGPAPSGQEYSPKRPRLRLVQSR